MSEDRIVWPKEMAQFVAYDSRPRRAALPDGQTVTMRAQVYVRFYDAVKVRSVNIGGQAGTSGDSEPETAYVTFDPSSVGLEHPFGASIRPDDPGCALLQESSRTGRPVMVALETIRRARSRGRDPQPISPLAPIHALRGANVDGAGGDPATAKQNCKNLVVMVEGNPTAEITSDPAEWVELTDNKAGNLPPQGWEARRPADVNGWIAYGIVVPAESRQPNPAPAPTDAIAAIDRATLCDTVAQVVREQLAAALPTMTADPTGDTLATYRSAVSWAHRLVVDSIGADAFDPTRDSDRLWALVDRLLTMADRLDAAVAADRPAIHEARGWIAWVVEHFYPVPAAAFTDPAAGGEWAATVEALATRYYTEAQTRLLLAQIEQAWDDADALRAAFATTRTRRLADTPVAIGSPNGKVRIVPAAQTPGQGWKNDQLGTIVVARGRVLTGQTSGATP